MRFFGQIERAGISHLPIVGNARPGQNQDMGIWHINGCKVGAVLSTYFSSSPVHSTSIEVRHLDNCAQVDLFNNVFVIFYKTYSMIVKAFH